MIIERPRQEAEAIVERYRRGRLAITSLAFGIGVADARQFTGTSWPAEASI